MFPFTIFTPEKKWQNENSNFDMPDLDKRRQKFGKQMTGYVAHLNGIIIMFFGDKAHSDARSIGGSKKKIQNL